MAFTWLWVISFYAFCVLANTVDLKVTPFKNLPSRIYYFDDTEFLLYHDPGEWDIWRSSNEGKDWKKVDILAGKALMLIPHPHDNRYAFVLTPDNIHYRTTNRGETWQEFKMPLPPALVPSPLSFHADKSKYGYILYQGSTCRFPLGMDDCHDETWITEEAFGDEPRLLRKNTSQCLWAHHTQVIKGAPEKLIFCVAFDQTAVDGSQSLEASRLFSSEDYFKNDIKIVDFGIGKQAKGVVALGVVSKFMVAALKDLSSRSSEMMLYVSVDAKTWAKGKFPHASSSKLHENAYTIVESTTHSLAIDVLLHSTGAVGNLFVSNSNGTFFVESLKDTNRNEAGYVDFEEIVGVEGVGIANIVANAQEVEAIDAEKKIKSRITFDDGSSWTPIKAPSHDVHGKEFKCDTSDLDKCSLHLHSVTNPHNFGRIFSSRAPGFVMGVGSVGDHLQQYADSDTFLSVDAGLTWKMVHTNAHIHQFGAQGSVMVIIDDEEYTDHLNYSWDDGKTWQRQQLPVTVRARALTTVPDSTSQKVLLLGQLSKKSQDNGMKYATIFIDFATLGKRQCDDADFEKWYARTAKGKECLMGHKQWYNRRKADANCFVGHKFTDPVEHEQNCPCTDEDYECDYNYVRQGDHCVSAGPEPIPAGVCAHDRKGTYMGSSGYRLIPGNTCEKPKQGAKDEPIQKDCSKAQPPEGSVVHQTFQFPSQMVQYVYFRNSHTLLVQTEGGHVWQSSNEGYTWSQVHPEEHFLAIYMNTFSDDRAYLITKSQKLYITTDHGQTWIQVSTPMKANALGLSILNFHPLQSDWLIWTGSTECESGPNGNCRAVAYYSTNHGRSWTEIESYVRQCSWARDKDLKIDARQIICESYRDKKGNQMMFKSGNPLELVNGSNFYKDKTRLFKNVVGYAKFSEYLLVAEIADAANALDLQVSLDGRHFAQGLFPPNMRLDNHAYTILESSTDSVFLHVTMSQARGAEWGNLLKSNSNGTYYGLSLQYVNRNERGYVDFEKLIGLDGIAVMNIVANPEEAAVVGKKLLQTRITHNDGGSWKPLTPPPTDSLGQKYECSGAQCALHIHGYTERFDARATYSSPSAIGLMMAVGSVGKHLASYTDSDTFFSRDGGFTWEEVHKDAHLFEFGDSGSVLVMANDEGPTDRVLYSVDEGISWREYVFVGGAGSGADGKMRVREIVTVPKDTSRKFILFGYYPSQPNKLVAVHVDFSSLTSVQCVLDSEHPQKDDFELWSPSEEREERCLFGRQTLYHRRLRDHNCYIGEQTKTPERIVKNCQCSATDFECEFNHNRNSEGECVLVDGATPLPDDDTCPGDDEYWYERTAYRKIPFSSCEGGDRPDRGKRHYCPGPGGKSGLFWWTMGLLPFVFTGLVGYWYYKKGGFQRGTIRLPDSNGRTAFDDTGPLSTLASVPWFLLGVAAAGYGWLTRLRLPFITDNLQSRRGYRTVPVDEDAQVLRFEDEE